MILFEEITWRDPATAFALWQKGPYVAWLDSASPLQDSSRYSYLGVQPFQVIETTGQITRVNGRAIGGDPFIVLERALADFRVSPDEMPVPFIGGAIGFLGYELGAHLERLPQRHANDLGIPTW
jgi:para-aminobenzoate synthetase component I